MSSDICIEDLARTKSVMLLPKGYHSSTCKKMQDEYWDDQLVTDRLNDIDNESNSQIYQFLIDKIKEMASVDKGL
jgi:hypothetical protein